MNERAKTKKQTPNFFELTLCWVQPTGVSRTTSSMLSKDRADTYRRGSWRLLCLFMYHFRIPCQASGISTLWIFPWLNARNRRYTLNQPMDFPWISLMNCYTICSLKIYPTLEHRPRGTVKVGLSAASSIGNWNLSHKWWLPPSHHPWDFLMYFWWDVSLFH